jgi:hypothetical protein
MPSSVSTSSARRQQEATNETQHQSLSVGARRLEPIAGGASTVAEAVVGALATPSAGAGGSTPTVGAGAPGGATPESVERRWGRTESARPSRRGAWGGATPGVGVHRGGAAREWCYARSRRGYVAVYTHRWGGVTPVDRQQGRAGMISWSARDDGCCVWPEIAGHENRRDRASPEFASEAGHRDGISSGPFTGAHEQQRLGSHQTTGR